MTDKVIGDRAANDRARFAISVTDRRAAGVAVPGQLSGRPVRDRPRFGSRVVDISGFFDSANCADTG